MTHSTDAYAIEATDLCFAYDRVKGYLILQNIKLAIQKRSIVAILGRSGVGKSTLLRLLAGRMVPTSGRVCIDPASRPCIYMSQQDVLLPWRSVRSNISLGAVLAAETLPANAVSSVADELGLRGMLDALPGKLSGGYARRTSLARALVRSSSLLLLDEPFSHMDAPQRKRLSTNIRENIQRASRTCVFISHEISDALKMADRVVVVGGVPGTIVLDERIDRAGDTVSRALETRIWDAIECDD